MRPLPAALLRRALLSLVLASVLSAAAPSAPLSVRAFGARGDGRSDDTAAIQAAVNAAAAQPGRTLVFQPTAGGYRMGRVVVPSNTGLTIDGRGARLHLVGRDAGFRLQGTLSGTTLRNLVIEGDGRVESAQAGVANASGQVLRGLSIVDCRVRATSIGISVNADLGGRVQDVLLRGNRVEDVVGTAPGQGYGLHLASGQPASEPMRARIVGNTVVRSQRHGIYVARGYGVRVEGNVLLDHRRGVADGNFRDALAVARGGDVVVAGNRFERCSDSCLGVWGGGRGVRDVAVEGNTFVLPRNAVPALWIGDDVPSKEGTTERVRVRGNRFEVDSGADAIRVRSGRDVELVGNAITSRSTWAANGITLRAGDDAAGTAAYTDRVRLVGNTVRVHTRVGTAAAVRLEGSFCTSAAGLELVGNAAAGTELYLERPRPPGPPQPRAK